MMNNELSYFYDWKMFPDELYPHIAREFLDNGVNRFVFPCDIAAEIVLERPEKEEYMRKLCQDLHIEFVSMHGLCGKPMDLDIPESEDRRYMLKSHIRAMEIAERFGSKTYTVHVGAYYYCTEHILLPELRKLANQSLEVLVPEAERIGIVLAVENSFEPPNSAKEVLDLVTPFLSSPAIGICFDTGHANCMASAPGKKIENYYPYFKTSWWETGVVQEDHALELLMPHIVTCHMHDNNGYSDLHAMPGDGTVDWQKTVSMLKQCPRMLEFQTEVECKGGTNWAGKSPAPEGGYSIRRLVDTFKKMGF